MNDRFKNEKRDDEIIAQKLNHVAEQTHANSQFATDLEERLRQAHQPNATWFSNPFAQLSPTLRWLALMVLLALVLSWSIRSLIPAPQPANELTPVVDPATTFTPAPNILPELSATPATQEGSFDFRGAKLFLNQPLPKSPQTTHVYAMNPDEPASLEQARALAAQFGMQGEIYSAPGYLFNTDDYLIIDGKRSLQVHSDKYFVYTADMENNHNVHPASSDEEAEKTIREFFTAHGFDFPFQVYSSEYYSGYVVQPLAPDGIPMQYESYTLPMLRVTLDQNGQVLVVDASLMNYDPNALGEYGIISVQEAFDRLLDDTLLTGKMEFVHAPINNPIEWYHSYPDNQSVTVYGYITVYPALEAGKPPLLVMDGVSLIGNVTGMETLERNSFISMTGQYIVENGVRKFNVESWDRKVSEVWISGMLSRQGDQVIFTSDDGSETQYVLADPPADLPIGSQTPENSLGISGVIDQNNVLSWYYIQFFESNSGGGGGGGNGFGFYKLNLSGVPIPFPSPTPRPGANARMYVVKENDTLASIALNFGVSVDALMQANGIIENLVVTGDELVIPSTQQEPSNPLTGIYTVQEGDTLAAIAQKFGTSVATLHDLNGLTDENIIFVGQDLIIPGFEPQEQKVEDLYGYISISLHVNADGTSVKKYALDAVQNSGGSSLYTMEGEAINSLADGYNGLPIIVTGTINTAGKLVVDSVNVPYPDLQFQILKGRQRTQQLEGQNVVIFTTEDGQSFVEFLATNPFPTDAFIVGIEGDLVEEEVLIIPDETFGGMPVAHVYQSAIFQENGSAMEVQANRIYVNDESGDPGTEYTQPDLTIDKVELVYFASNPYYQVNDPNYELRSKYVQPVWHFQGTYADGTAFDIVIQALKQEFLLPELVPNPGIG